MTQTIISLLSIIAGIIGANIMSKIFPKYSFGIIGNTISGVFGSIVLIKSIGRLGFDPNSIMETGELNIILFVVNILISLLGGGVAVFIGVRIKNTLNNIN